MLEKVVVDRKQATTAGPGAERGETKSEPQNQTSLQEKPPYEDH